MRQMKRRLLFEVPLFLYVVLMIQSFTYVQGEQVENSLYNMQEKLAIEKHNLEKLRTQLQILKTNDEDEKLGQRTGFQTHKPTNGSGGNISSIVITPNENIVITKEIGEYDVPVYSIDAAQVKIIDVLQALSASFGKSILVDDELDPTHLASYVNISIKKSPLQDIIEVLLGLQGLEFIQDEDAIFVTSMAKLMLDTPFEYYRDKSIQLYQKAQIKYPNDRRIVKAYFELGNYYYELGFYFLALQEYQIVVGKYRGSQEAKDALFKIGRCYDKLKDSESARRAYFQFLCSYPKDPLASEAFLSIGDSLAEQGFYHKAIDIYSKIIREHAENESGTAVDAQFRMAKTCMQMGDYRAAIPLFLKVRWKHFSEQTRLAIEYYIGNCLYLLNEYQDAGNVMANYLASGQGLEFAEDAGFLLGECLYRQNNYIGAFQIFRKTIEDYPKSNKIPYGMYYMGKCLMAMNMAKSAIKVFYDGIQSYSADVYAAKMALEIGKCYFDKEDYWLAYNAFGAFVKEYPNDEFAFEGMLGIADSLFHDKKYEEAINNYYGLLKMVNDGQIKRYVFNRIGECYKHLGKLEDAIKAYRQSLDNDENANQLNLRRDDSLGFATSNLQHM
ncbi:MAG: hypothetical protein DCC43_00035 [Candidatus Brocadia sp.]|nr:hypothetical protein [Candidatus Brocadia sp. AMX3]MDG5996208.1 tetratricopeptide repeat protein [Candidatus Brocadia sp.]RIK03419.1 MAG: hypothetical protein DCC43_00035 [Candidatus Brocadia sp.]